MGDNDYPGDPSGMLGFEGFHGAEAKAALEAGASPLAIVLDLLVPVMDGWSS